jgi:Lrp/AsnC family transcriptional regulator, leucine-responsive regulatory protein
MQKKVTLDETDWKILEALQRDGRCSFRDLALQIALSPPATAERVRRLEADGVIAGYQAVLDPATLGHGLEAIVRISVASGRQCVTLLDELAKVPEVLEAYRVTGTESAVARIAVSSSAHLQLVIDRLTTIGKPTTSICTSSFRRTPQFGRATPRSPSPVRRPAKAGCARVAANPNNFLFATPAALRRSGAIWRKKNRLNTKSLKYWRSRHDSNMRPTV